MTLATALRQGIQLLERGGIGVPRLTAEVLLAHALRRERTYLYAHPEHELLEVEWIHYGRYLHERLNRKPTQYITKVQEFYGRAFEVSRDVLIPRPETEHVVEACLPLARAARNVVDVGTGSGAIAITLAMETGRLVIGVDLSPSALAIAARNAQRLGASVAFACADSLSSFAPASIGLIVSNPPYVALVDRDGLAPEVRDWEPAMALFAGPNGLDFYRALIPQAGLILETGGSLVVELGAGQSESVARLLGAEWETPTMVPDLAGIDRVLAVRKKL